MDKNTTFLVVGGDFRQNFLATRLSKFSSRVYTLGLSRDHKCEGCTELSGFSDIGFMPDVVVLPLPATNDGKTVNAPFSDEPIYIDRLMNFCKKDSLIVGGKMPEELCDRIEKRSLCCADYFGREELIIENCVPTAEGALSIAMENTARTIAGSDVLILGFGRVAKAVARTFSALSAKVHICARKGSDLVHAKTLGYSPVPIANLCDRLKDFDIVINTVPAVLLGEKELEKADPDTLIIDLASKPGGVDFKSASEKHLKVIWALSLPPREKMWEKSWLTEYYHNLMGIPLFEKFFPPQLVADFTPENL